MLRVYAIGALCSSFGLGAARGTRVDGEVVNLHGNAPPIFMMAASLPGGALMQSPETFWCSGCGPPKPAQFRYRQFYKACFCNKFFES